MVWMSDDSRIAVEPIKTAGKASVKKTEQQVDIQCTASRLTSPAHANLTVSLSIAATIHHHYIIALETTCGTETVLYPITRHSPD
jgi:hypothetical protein